MRAHPFFSLIVTILGFLAKPLVAQPQVSNIRASQQPGTTQIAVSYDLKSTTGTNYTVTLEVSRDGGATYAAAIGATGAVGAGIDVGTGKTIFWKVGPQWPAQQLDNAKIRVTATDSGGFALIPAGTFTMGNNLEKDTSMLPLHAVTLPAFSMATTLITAAEWQTVREWAATNGYTDLVTVGAGKSAAHPVQTVSWYDAVKWCNAKSEKEGLTPCYYTNDRQTTIYRTGAVDVTSIQVKWTADGYRLPTEAEWEYAARGGLAGKRFPWGDTISHTQANYFSSASYAYDVSATRGDNPSYSNGLLPYTSPVKAFAPNGYGLYDMAGNVWEWCWDWYGLYGSASQKEPRGPEAGTYRVFRGGSWRSMAEHCSVAFRYGATPGAGDYFLGFRIASSSTRPAESSAATVSAESPLFVVDTRPPGIATHPASTQVKAGAAATFTVATNNAVPPSFRWERLPAGDAMWSAVTGAPYNGATTASLTVDPTTTAMNGDQFRCVASNGVSPDATSEPATLAVVVPPQIITLPVSQTVLAGNSVTIAVGATGTPPLTYQWQKEGVDLPGETAPTLVFPNVRPADAGEYRVIVANEAGRTPSSPATLSVTTIPLGFTTQPADQIAAVGTTVDFKAAATGAPAPTYQWYLNGVPAEGHTAANFGPFTVANFHDGWTFACVATNSDGSVTSRTATLRLPTVPAITTQPTDLVVASGALADFSVTATGVPAAVTYQWYLNGVPAEGHTSANFGAFTVASFHDGWTFACVATNAAGSTTSRTATLRLPAIPTITSQPSDLLVAAGTSVDFGVVATGAPAPTYQWYLNGVLAEGHTSANFGAFTVASFHDGWTFACVATNPSGNVTSRTATLRIPAAPVITTQPADLLVKVGTDVDFAVAATGVPTPTYQWYLNNEPLADHTAAHFGAFTVAAYHDGWKFKCVATNANGQATSRTATLSLAAPPVISAQSHDLGLAAGQPAALAVTAVTATAYQWYKGGIAVPAATNATLTLASLVPADAGLYDCLVTGPGGETLSAPIVVGVQPASGQRTAGAAITRNEWQNILHPVSGATYDQFLLAGPAGTITADPGQVARLSFLDENDSIVQVEMSGAGAVTVVLADATGPLAPTLYNQSGVEYMKGKATVVLSGADATTHFTIYSVGTVTNPAVTRPEAPYAGWAAVAAAGIVSTDGKLGGIHQGNVSYASNLGFAGIYAPTVAAVGGRVVVHDIAAGGSAQPYLHFAPTGRVEVLIAGGALAQPNGDSITVAGLAKVEMGAGQDSCGKTTAAQSVQGRLADTSGNDVTAALVVAPTQGGQ